MRLANIFSANAYERTRRMSAIREGKMPITFLPAPGRIVPVVLPRPAGVKRAGSTSTSAAITTHR